MNKILIIVYNNIIAIRREQTKPKGHLQVSK